MHSITSTHHDNVSADSNESHQSHESQPHECPTCNAPLAWLKREYPTHREHIWFNSDVSVNGWECTECAWK